MEPEPEQPRPAASMEARWFHRLDRWAAVSWRFVVVVIAVAVAAWLIAQLRLILLPTVFAAFVCTVLIPVRNRYEAIGVPRLPAAMLSLFTGLAGIALLIFAIVPPIVSESDDIASSIEEAYDGIFEWLEDGPFGLTPEQGQDLRADLESAEEAVLDAVASGAVSGLPIVFEVGAGILLAIVVTFFFLRDGERIWNWSVGLLPETEHARAHRAGHRVWDTLTRYLRGLAVVAVVDAIGIGLGAYIIGVPLVVPIAVLTLVTAFVPIVGAVVAGIVAMLIAFADGGITDAAWMLGVVLLVQQLEANLVAPALIGRSVEIHPLVILLGVAAGGAIAGVLGAVLVTPLAAVGTVLIREFLGDHPQTDDDAEPPGEDSAADPAPA